MRQNVSVSETDPVHCEQEQEIRCVVLQVLHLLKMEQSSPAPAQKLLVWTEALSGIVFQRSVSLSGTV